MRKVKLLTICLVISSVLIGCQSKPSQSCENVIYNSLISDNFVDGGNYIYGYVSNNFNGFTNIIKNKSTGKVESFVRNPFFNEKENDTYINHIYIDNVKNKGYYLDNRGTDYEDGFSIIEFDLSTFKEKEMYRESYALGKRVLLGLNEVKDFKVHKENDFSENKTDSLGNLTMEPRYFIDNGYIYLIRRNGIFKVDMKSKKQTQLINEYEIQSISFDGKYIYYINNAHDLYRYNITTGEKLKLTSNKSEYLIITENKIIYTNLNDKSSIYMMNKDGSNEHKINNSASKSLNYDEEYIYYCNIDDKNALYRIKYDGSKNEKMTDKPAYFINTFKNYDKVYISSDDINGGGIKDFAVDKKDFNVELLEF